MKKILILIVVVFGACKSAAISQDKTDKKVLVYYAKQACLGKCPVFDLWVYEDGSFLYNGIKNSPKKGKHEGTLTGQQLSRLKNKLSDEELVVVALKKIRDKPITKLHYKGKQHHYYVNRADEDLKRIDAELNALLSTIF